MDTNLFKQTCNSLNIGIIIINADNTIQFCNHWIQKHCKHDLSKSVNKPLLEIFPEVRDTLLQSAINECLLNNTPSYLSSIFHNSPLELFRDTPRQKNMLKQDISVLPVQLQKHHYCVLQINDVSSRTNREFSLKQEIQRRQEMEESLQKSEARLKSILDNSPFLISMKDLSGRVILVNKQFELLKPPKSGQFVGENLYEHFPDETANNLRKNDLQAVNSLRPVESEEIIEHRDNKPHIYHTVKFPIIENDRATAVGAISLDITERKEIENQRNTLTLQLQQTQKMESIGQLTGGIAHDFNNILTAVLGYTQLSMESIKQGKTAKLNQYLDEVYQAASKAQNLVQQMLAFSRGQKVEMEETDIQTVLNDSVSLLKPTLPTSIRLHIQTDNDLPTVQAHPIQLSQAILNLAINARDALQGKGKIEISLQRQQLQQVCCASCHEYISGPFVCISIRDNGPGIPKERLARIFEPFFTTKQLGKGSGMGLSMVHGIIHGFGGHIIVDTEAGKGTNFQILLPIYQSNHAGNAKSKSHFS